MRTVFCQETCLSFPLWSGPVNISRRQLGLAAAGICYYDAIVMHGPGNDPVSFGGIRKTAMKKPKTPAQGGDQVKYLNAFLDARKAAMKTRRRTATPAASPPSSGASSRPPTSASSHR